MEKLDTDTTSEKKDRIWLRIWQTSSVPLAAVLLAALIGAIILIVSGANPITAYAALLQGAFGSVSTFGRTLEKATPLIFSGLAVYSTGVVWGWLGWRFIWCYSRRIKNLYGSP